MSQEDKDILAKIFNKAFEKLDVIASYHYYLLHREIKVIWKPDEEIKRNDDERPRTH